MRIYPLFKAYRAGQPDVCKSNEKKKNIRKVRKRYTDYIN